MSGDKNSAAMVRDQLHALDPIGSGGSRPHRRFRRRRGQEFTPHDDHDDYDVAWICALYIEMAAARAMLDETHDDLPMHPSDSNSYILGSIAKHNVVIACLPDSQYGTNNAANVAANLVRTFKSIRVGLMVGIGGGVPGKLDVRLGDVVVGSRVMQYDLGKILDGGHIQRTAIPRIIPRQLGTTVSNLRSRHELHPSQIPVIIQEKLANVSGYCRPDLPDRLFQSSYSHNASARTCDECDPSKLQFRADRASKDPVIHYGAIASGNQVVKDASTRDRIAGDLDVICFEMEAAGLVDSLPCLTIRGICDYSDSHKSKEWQRYAAAAAAAYTRELLEIAPTTRSVDNEPGASLEVSFSRADTLVDASLPLLESLNPAKDWVSDIMLHRRDYFHCLMFDQMNTRQSTIKQAHDRTCEWFLKHPGYQAWLDPEQLRSHHGFLWVSGKPGAGKSTIMKFAFSSMKEQASKHNQVVASFFFNARGESLEKTISGMYRSLIVQLVSGYPNLQPVLDGYKLPPQLPTGFQAPPLETLKNIFQDAVLALGPNPFTCFIDALDECDEQQAIDMVQYFENLTEISTAKGILFRVCFSSRHYPYIDIRGSIRFTLEDQVGHAQDLSNYVESRLRVRDPEILNELKPLILEKAAGVFLWIALVVDILNKEDRYGRPTLRKRVTELPSGLSQLFHDILTRDNENIEDLQLSILWILYAKRPLKPEEYYHALWSGLYFLGTADLDIPSVSTLSAMIERYVTSSSKGLAEITKSHDRRVQFIHESVRDFLIRDGGLHQLWPDIDFDVKGPSNELIKACCDAYINHAFTQSTVQNNFDGASIFNAGQVFAKLPLLEYISQHLLYHADAAGEMIPQQEFLSRFVNKNWSWLSPLDQAIDVIDTNDPKWMVWNSSDNILYYLAEKGFSALIRGRLQSEPFIDVLGGEHRYPLFAALVNGHKAAAAALLESRIPILDKIDLKENTTVSKEPMEYLSRTPLSWAAQNGYIEIVKRLIAKGSVVNEADKGCKTPLSRAAMSGHLEIVEYLLHKGSKVHGVDKGGKTPLSRAAKNGHKPVVQVLIKWGADVNAQNSDSSTPLCEVSSSGSVAAARILVDHGALVHHTTTGGWTPLLLALKNGHEKLARFFIQSGANINATTKINGWSPLLLALQNKFETLSILLIKQGARISSSQVYGWTPLLLASKTGLYSVAKMLIERGADLHQQNIYQWTPFSIALRSGHLDIVELLIEYGLDINSRGANGLTPLQMARNMGNLSIAEWLINHGAHDVG